MVEFRIRINPDQHLAYIPKEIYNALGPELKAVANRCAVLIFPVNTGVADILKSIKIIEADLKHAQQLSLSSKERR